MGEICYLHVRLSITINQLIENRTCTFSFFPEYIYEITLLTIELFALTFQVEAFVFYKQKFVTRYRYMWSRNTVRVKANILVLNSIIDFLSISRKYVCFFYRFRDTRYMLHITLQY